MSRSNKSQSTKKATPNEPYQEVPEDKRYYIGKQQARLDISVQKPDRYEYDRWKASRKLGLPEWDLPDEPDSDIYNLKEKE